MVDERSLNYERLVRVHQTAQYSKVYWMVEMESRDSFGLGDLLRSRLGDLLRSRPTPFYFR